MYTMYNTADHETIISHPLSIT